MQRSSCHGAEGGALRVSAHARRAEAGAEAGAGGCGCLRLVVSLPRVSAMGELDLELGMATVGWFGWRGPDDGGGLACRQ